MLTRVLGGLLSPGGARGGLSILIFHRVLPSPDVLYPGEVDATRFDTLLGWLAASFSVLPLEQAVRSLQRGALPPRALSITFDDGYADNYMTACPLLQKHGLHATFFVATDFLDGGRMWNDTVIEVVRRVEPATLDLRDLGIGIHPVRTDAERRIAIDSLLPRLKYLPLGERADRVAEIANRHGRDLPNDLMMTSGQLRALRRCGMAIGGHTRRHPILARLDDEAAVEEIAGGKSALEARLGEPVRLFAYPNGKPDTDFDRRHVEMVRKAGYVGAVTTSPGMARPGGDVYQLPRFTPWDRSRLRFGLRMVDNMRVSGGLAR